MKSAACLSKRHRDCSNYDGKTVEFLYDVGGRLLVLTGRFISKAVLQRWRVAIRYTGRLHSRDLPWTDYQFRLSALHLRTVAPAARRGSEADYVMEQPLTAEDCLKWVFGGANGESTRPMEDEEHRVVDLVGGGRPGRAFKGGEQRSAK